MNFGQILERSRLEYRRERDAAEKVEADERSWLAGVLEDGFSKIAAQFSLPGKAAPVRTNVPSIPVGNADADRDKVIAQAKTAAFADGVAQGLAGHKSRCDAEEAERKERVRARQARAHDDYYRDFRTQRQREDDERAAEEADDRAEASRAAVDEIRRSNVRVL